MKTRSLLTIFVLSALIGSYFIWPKIRELIQFTGSIPPESIGPHTPTDTTKADSVQSVEFASKRAGINQSNGGAKILDVDKMLREASLVTNRNEQAEAYSNVTRALCEAGLFDQAWSSILSGTGYNRTSQLDKFFLLAPLSRQQALSKITSLSDAPEQKVSVAAFLAKNINELSDLLKDSNFNQLFLQRSASDPSFLVDVVGEALRTNFDVFAKNPEAKEQANALLLDYHKKGLVSDNVLATMVYRNQNKTITGIELWKWFANTTMGIDTTNPFDLEVREGVVDGMVVNNPSQALQDIVANKNVNAAFDLYTGLNRWTALDPSAASKWYEINKTELSPEQSDYAAKAFAKSAIEVSEQDGAEQWASKITNQRLRESVENEIAIKFKKGR